jgi:Raf kinase inhibitor-like YbhB/YbcL family protein
MTFDIGAPVSHKLRFTGIVFVLTAALWICPKVAVVRSAPLAVAQAQEARQMAFAISSTSFPRDGDIPKKFTCDGADVSPELSWTSPPQGTHSLALIAADPDAPSGTWTHWVLFNIPASTKSLSEGLSRVDELPGGERQGRNDFRKIGYNGPCPPPGKTHRYFFKLFALDKQLDTKPGASRQEVEQAMQGHVLASADWMGKYHR